MLRGDCTPLVRNVRVEDVMFWFSSENNFGEWVELRAEDGGLLRLQTLDDDEFEQLMVPPDELEDLDDWQEPEEMLVLSYRDGETGQRHEAVKRVTVRHGEQAFLDYLRGNVRWRMSRRWREVRRFRRC